MSIASQQLSVKAADTIFRRFCDLFPPDRKPTPAGVMTLTDDQIRAVGYSRPKVSFIPTARQLRKIGEAWAPYRSVAAWYLWASLAKPPSPKPSRLR